MLEWLWDVLMHLLLVFYVALMVIVSWLRFGILNFINSRTLPPRSGGTHRAPKPRELAARKGWAPAQWNGQAAFTGAPS